MNGQLPAPSSCALDRHWAAPACGAYRGTSPCCESRHFYRTTPLLQADAEIAIVSEAEAWGEREAALKQEAEVVAAYAAKHRADHDAALAAARQVCSSSRYATRRGWDGHAYIYR